MDKVTRGMMSPRQERSIINTEKTAEMLDFIEKVKQLKDSPEIKLAIETNENDIHFVASRLLKDFKTTSKIPIEMLEHFAYKNKIDIYELAAACEIVEEENTN